MRIQQFSLASVAFFLGFLLVYGCSSSDESQERNFDPERIFQRFDKNTDGLISWDEFKDAPSRRGSPEERFQMIDKDADGYLTREEFLSARPEGGRGERRGGGRRGGGSQNR